MTARRGREVWTEDDVRALGVRTDLVTAASALSLGRTKAHELARRGEFPVPVLRIGQRYVVPVRGLLDLLGITPNDSEAGAPTPALATTANHDHGGHSDRSSHADYAPAAVPMRATGRGALG